MNQENKKTLSSKVKKTKKQSNKSIIDEDAMLKALENAKPHKKTCSAFNVLEKHISIIDKKQKEGFSLKEIYTIINDATPLNISHASFSRYIIDIRKKVGSDMYKPQMKRRKKEIFSKEPQQDNNPVQEREQKPNQHPHINTTSLVCTRCGKNGLVSGVANGEKRLYCKYCHSMFKNNNNSVGDFLFVRNNQ